MQAFSSTLPFAPPRYNYEDYKNWSDEWELIDGYPYSLMPSPKRKHQLFNNRFSRLAGNILAAKSCDCEIVSELDWIVNETTVVRPDTMIVCGKIKTDFLTFSPVLILEIGSPSTAPKDRTVKFKLYELNKVKYYLLADTENKKADCFEWVEGKYQIKTDLHFQLTEDCAITLTFDGLWA